MRDTGCTGRDDLLARPVAAPRAVHDPGFAREPLRRALQGPTEPPIDFYSVASTLTRPEAA